jgi:hypothetical protein
MESIEEELKLFIQSSEFPQIKELLNELPYLKIQLLTLVVIGCSDVGKKTWINAFLAALSSDNDYAYFRGFLKAFPSESLPFPIEIHTIKTGKFEIEYNINSENKKETFELLQKDQFNKKLREYEKIWANEYAKDPSKFNLEIILRIPNMSREMVIMNTPSLTTKNSKERIHKKLKDIIPVFVYLKRIADEQCLSSDFQEFISELGKTYDESYSSICMTRDDQLARIINIKDEEDIEGNKEKFAKNIKSFFTNIKEGCSDKYGIRFLDIFLTNAKSALMNDKICKKSLKICRRW